MKFFDHLIDFMVFGFGRNKEVDETKPEVYETKNVSEITEKEVDNLRDMLEQIVRGETLPNFDKMTKLDIDIWARDELGLKLDRRKTKEHMIEQIHNHINKES